MSVLLSSDFEFQVLAQLIWLNPDDLLNFFNKEEHIDFKTIICFGSILLK